jgi:hypothetical protein
MYIYNPWQLSETSVQIVFNGLTFQSYKSNFMLRRNYAICRYPYRYRILPSGIITSIYRYQLAFQTIIWGIIMTGELGMMCRSAGRTWMILRNITAKLIISGPQPLPCYSCPRFQKSATEMLWHRVGRNRRELVHIEFWWLWRLDYLVIGDKRSYWHARKPTSLVNKRVLWSRDSLHYVLCCWMSRSGCFGFWGSGLKYRFGDLFSWLSSGPSSKFRDLHRFLPHSV